MKLTVTLDHLATLSRYDPAPLLARLQTEVERELQATAASDTPIDAAARQAALERALARISLSPPASMRSMASP
jgi:hypothetical protein